MPEPKWWQKGIVYEIYARSFKDSNGDGVGDIEGIIEKLDYFVWLGIDALWLTPIFTSPMLDFGYDISDFRDIDPQFGKLETFDRLVQQAHARDLRVVLDLVPNHTSDRHPWFRESRSSRHNPKRDWYIWRDPKPGGNPPNNWISTFGGSAWTLDEATAQYYYHAFAPEQPDLNWRNADVVREMHDVMRFWLDRGVDGFRVDAVSRLIKDDRFRDNPRNPKFRHGMSPDDAHKAVYTRDRPEIHNVIAGLRRVVDEYADRVLIGELYLAPERVITYYGKDLRGLHLPLNFQLMFRSWRAREAGSCVEDYERILPPDAWPNWVLGNHDTQRLISRIGLDQARVAAMLILTLRGTPMLYYGDEIGMEDQKVYPRYVHDLREKNCPGMGLGRDPARTPMQWDESDHAGFTTGSPWLPVSANSTDVNVETEAEDPRSILTLYRRLIQLRRAHPILSLGSWGRLASGLGALVYVRESAGTSMLVALNFSADPLAVLLPASALSGRILLSTYLDREDERVENELDLRGDEGVVVLSGA